MRHLVLMCLAALVRDSHTGATAGLSELSTQPTPMAGTWASELGPVTITTDVGPITGSWMTRTGRRGEILSGRFDGDHLTLEYSWPWVPVRGVATFAWNPSSSIVAR